MLSFLEINTMSKEIFSPVIKVSLIVMIYALQSCVPVTQLKYFNDIDEIKGPVVNPKTQKNIMPFDKLYIKVLSVNPQTNQIFSTGDEIRVGSTGAGAIAGYPVDEGGNINFPFVGLINVGGLNTTQAAGKIEKALSDYVPNITVVVKYIDNQVTVIGEVQRQGVYNFSQDRISIYDALGLGGGITRYGDRRNIVLTRNIGEKIVHYRLNLSDSRIMSKEYYYIQPNDIVIVEPLKAVSTSYSNITYTTVLSSITTLIAVLLFTGVKF
jgi:polysaccharide export outer membrane protein